jgi:hypothetical protein
MPAKEHACRCNNVQKVLIVTWTTIFLALLSYFTTVRKGEVDWPSACLQIRVVDAADLPVEGAQLSVFRGNTPLSEFQEKWIHSSDSISNKAGTIDLLISPMRWTETSWRLFWVIPVRPSNYVAKIEAPGFRPASVPILTLLDDAGLKENRRVTDAEVAKEMLDEEIGVYHTTVVLTK